MDRVGIRSGCDKYRQSLFSDGGGGGDGDSFRELFCWEDKMGESTTADHGAKELHGE